jgi:hypothetical protein
MREAVYELRLDKQFIFHVTRKVEVAATEKESAA